MAKTLTLSSEQESATIENLRALKGLANIVLPVGVGDAANKLDVVSRGQIYSLITVLHGNLAKTLQAAGLELFED